MDELGLLLNDSVTRLFKDRVDKTLIQNAETNAFADALWSEVEDAGLPRALVSETGGGTDAGWQNAVLVLLAIGEHAAPIPLAETLIANCLLDGAGLAVPDGPVTFSDVLLSGKNGTVTGTLERLPWARHCTSVAAPVSTNGGGVRFACLPVGEARIEEDENLAREPRDTLHFDGVSAALSDTPADPEEILRFGAFMRAAQIAGGLSSLQRQAVEYANERSQFGRPIGKFQAIQHQLAVLATQAAASAAAVTHAAARLDRGPAAFEIAVAKTRADEAVSVGTSIAHQVHGAIGFTYEHGLHFVTRRLWSWRAEFGSGAYWARHIGRDAIGQGADALWPFITGRGAGEGSP